VILVVVVVVVVVVVTTTTTTVRDVSLAFGVMLQAIARQGC